MGLCHSVDCSCVSRRDRNALLHTCLTPTNNYLCIEFYILSFDVYTYQQLNLHLFMYLYIYIHIDIYVYIPYYIYSIFLYTYTY